MTKPVAGQSPGMQSNASPQPTEVLAGSIERVTFHNAENGFCVLRIKARGHRDLVTVVGHAAEISAGEWITLSGTWVNSREHGQRFKASFLRASAPTTAEGIEKYLGSGMIRGIGPALDNSAEQLTPMEQLKQVELFNGRAAMLGIAIGLGALVDGYAACRTQFLPFCF
jgi:ATP-dependent exoDNAse (exonuclease V) alpha subunit